MCDTLCAKRAGVSFRSKFYYYLRPDVERIFSYGVRVYRDLKPNEHFIASGDLRISTRRVFDTRTAYNFLSAYDRNRFVLAYVSATYLLSVRRTQTVRNTNGVFENEDDVRRVSDGARTNT